MATGNERPEHPLRKLWRVQGHQISSDKQWSVTCLKELHWGSGLRDSAVDFADDILCKEISCEVH